MVRLWTEGGKTKNVSVHKEKGAAYAAARALPEGWNPTFAPHLDQSLMTEPPGLDVAGPSDLLTALKGMVSEFDPGGDLDPDLSVNIPRIAARAAIAKAEAGALA